MPNELKFGVFFPCFTFRSERNPSFLFDRLKENVIECEKLEYTSVWLDDHLMLNEKPILECWTTLSALSRITQTIRLGTMVTCNSFRNPTLLAKMTATLDCISNGRLELGIGAGVQQKEHNAYGFSFPPSKVRIERLDEAVTILKKLWTENKANYSGKYYSIEEAICEPKPLQKPCPPIIIGGSGEKLTLKVTAKHANRFDWGYIPSIEEYKNKLKVLEKHCKQVGRNLCHIEKSCWPAGQIFIFENKKEIKKNMTKFIPENMSVDEFMQTNFVGTPNDCIKYLNKYMDVGVTQFMLYFGDFPNLECLRLFAKDVIPRMKEYS